MIEKLKNIIIRFFTEDNEKTEFDTIQEYLDYLDYNEDEEDEF